MFTTIISRYIAKRLLGTILTIFMGIFLLVLLVDFVELLRRAGSKNEYETFELFLISIFRVPELMERILPFATLFGAIFAFLNLSRKLELVIIRASGMSAWQFLTPAILVALGLGIFSFVIYNPGSALLKNRSQELEAKIFGVNFASAGQTSSQDWVRQNGKDGDSILRAHTSFDQGRKIGGITVFSYHENGDFLERVDAKFGELHNGYWLLSDAMVTSSDAAPRRYDTYIISTHMTPQEANEAIAKPEAVQFWDLPTIIGQAEISGLPAHKYRLRYQMLMAQPLLLAAMTLIAATVALRFFRFGSVGKLILGGVLAGFMLYVVIEIAKDLGNTGLVNPILAAWLPAIVASAMGFTILLYQEDG
ncbi:MAG: LPS export ABC transporter permease LptG [Cohaesibacter sp.]|nr:LPS export ABC transporter permease LptG [Cohaesibacter sp.]MCV6603130.1 LPS export ABC transporter permease LptG [Cohaesibacter sp.]